MRGVEPLGRHYQRADSRREERRAMIMQEIAPLPCRTPSASMWVLYVYNSIGYLTFDGRLIATASVATPRQEARIRGMLARLTGQRTGSA